MAYSLGGCTGCSGDHCVCCLSCAEAHRQPESEQQSRLRGLRAEKHIKRSQGSSGPFGLFIAYPSKVMLGVKALNTCTFGNACEAAAYFHKVVEVKKGQLTHLMAHDIRTNGASWKPPVEVCFSPVCSDCPFSLAAPLPEFCPTNGTCKSQTTVNSLDC